MRPRLWVVTLGVLFLVFLSPEIFASPPGNANYWTKIWSDEFNATNGLDATKWSWGSLPWGGNHHNSSYASTIVAGNSYLDGSGHLDLATRPGSFPATDGTTQPYSEGMAHTYNTFWYAYGYVEISANFSDATGSWPAFWMLKSGWPPEIDVAEWFASSSRMHTGLAWNNNGNTTWDDVNTYNSALANTWHTWGLDWSPGHLTIYGDSTQYWTSGGVGEVPMDPMYFILNSGVQAGYTSWWHDDLVDYIRVWKRNEVILNGDFETYYGGWNTANGAYAASAQGQGGTIAMCLNTASSGVVNSTAAQTVYGLQPNSAYVLTGWYHNDSGQNAYWPNLNLNVADAGGSSLVSTAWGANPNWSQGSVSFTTGKVVTNAVVSFQVQPTWGRIYVDNVLLRRAATVNNPNFESSYLDPYWNKSGNAWLLQTSPHSGQYAAQLHSGSSLSQEVAGLRTNTAYQLKVWATGPSWPGLQVAVTNSGGPNASLTITPGGGYTGATLSFTTGNSTTATLALVNSSQSSDYVYFADDLFLAEPLKSPWQGRDIGAVVLPGASGNRSSQIALAGSGGDIWGNADAFYYVCEPLTGDGTITARLCTEQSTSANAKAGVMMRESLDPGARHLLVDWLPQNVVETLWRTAGSGATSANWNTNVTTEPWVRLRRQGNVFTGFYSPDGIVWTQTTQQTIAMAGSIYAGLAVTAHDTAQLNESVFDQVTVDPSPLLLSAILSGSSLTLAWPGSAVGYTLQTSPMLGPGAVWVPVGVTPALAGGQYSVSVPGTGARAFYRLMR